jgi:prepilin-type N-terminal cleavage/methylation domain-containing protein
MPKKNQKLKGFTLIEMLIAVFVLAIGIVAVIGAFPLGTYLQKSGQLNTVAIQLAQAKMEEISSNSYDDILVGITEEDYGSISSFLSFKRNTEISFFDPDNPEVPPAGDLGIKKIEISVFWHSSLGISEREVKIANFIAQK